LELLGEDFEEVVGKWLKELIEKTSLYDFPLRSQRHRMIKGG